MIKNYSYCEEVVLDGKTYLKDYRIKNGMARYIRGKLGDLTKWYSKSPVLGDLLSSGILDMSKADYVIVEYKGQYGNMYAIGTITD